MQFETIRIDVEGTLGRLTLARPERLNALSNRTLRELALAARELDQRTEVKVVIVSGEGRSFSAGADLKDSPVKAASPRTGASWLERREIGQLGLRMADSIEQMRAITVAQVHGHAIGGGLVLMLACDLRVAARDTVFSIPEIELGIPLAWGGIPRLVREIGPAMTKELVMTCRRFTADEAKALGVLNRVVPAEKLTAEVAALASELCSKPQVPLVITKEHTNSIARSMGAGQTAFADGDVLLGTAFDPESREAGQRYTARTVDRHARAREV